MYVKATNDLVVAMNGDEYRRAAPPTEEWAAYEAWVAAGNAPQTSFTTEQWAALSVNSQFRLAVLAPKQFGAT